MPFKLGAIWAAIKLDTKQFNAAIKQVQGQTATSAKGATSAGTAYGGMWKKLAMGVGIAGGVTMVTRTLMNQFSDMVTTGREFESAWANVTTMMDSSGDEAKQMRDELIDLSPALGDTTELAEGMYQVLSASIPEDAAILFLESAAEAAVAGVTDTATAVDALTTVINAYGLEAGAVDSISDVMFETVKSGKLTYEELAASMGTVVPVAASTGVEFTEITGALAEMTKKGIPAQTATMQLRQVLMGILKPSKGAKEAMEELGLEYGENALQSKGLAGWLVDLGEKTQGSADKMSSVIENARSLTGVLALAGTGTEGLTDAVADMEGALDGGGQTAEAFDKQLSTMDITLDTLVTATDKFKISFYNGFVEGIEKGAPNAKDFDEITKDLSATFSTFGEVLGLMVVPAVKDFTAKINAVIAPVKAAKLVFKDITTLLKKGQVPTLKNVSKHYKELAEQEEATAKATEFISGWFKKASDAMDDLTAEVLAQNEANEESKKTYIDLLPEIKDTKFEFIDWLTKVGDGEMTIKEYNMRLDGMSESFIKLAKKIEDAEVLDPEDLEPYFTELESAPSALASVLAGVGVQLTETHDSIADHAETLTKETLPQFWENFATGVGTIYGNLIWDIMDKNSTFEESIDMFFENWLNMFKGMIADMVQSWMTDFIKEIISSSATAGASVAANLAESVGGEGADSLAGAFDSVGSAAGGLLNTLSGVANIVTAIASVANLFKKAGPSTTDSWNFEHIQINTKEMRDYIFLNIGSNSGWLARILDKNNAIHLTLQGWRKGQRDRLKGMHKALNKIEDHTAAMVKKLGSTKKAQTGAVSFQTELIQTHGTPSRPEYVLPHEDLSRAISGGGGASNNYISINVSDQIDPFTAQRMTRDVILPQVINALETKKYNRDLQNQLGLGT